MLSILLAGIWPIVWHLSIGSIIILGAIVGAIFVPVLRRDFIVLALLSALFMGGLVWGIQLEKGQCDARDLAVQKDVTTAVSKATKPAKAPTGLRKLIHPGGVRHDRWDQDWKS